MLTRDDRIKIFNRFKLLKRLKILISITTIIIGALSQNCLAQTDPNPENFLVRQGSAQHKGLLSSINLGIRYSSLLTNRGLVFYRDFQIDPVVGVFFLDDQIEYLGDSIGYKQFIVGDRIRVRTRLVAISDKPLFPAHESIKANAPQRKDTYEWSNRLEIFFPGYNKEYFGELDIGIAKDLSQHHGTYIDMLTKIKISDYRVPDLGTLIEPNFFAQIGWGDSAHNKYFYGPSATEAGLNNFAVGLWFAFPEEADRFYPIIQIQHFETLGNFKNAEYAIKRNQGWLFSFIATFGLLE